MKFESIILSVLAAATTVVQAMPVHTQSIDTNASNKQCADTFKMDQKPEDFSKECTEQWNHAVHVCGIEPAPQPGTAIPAEHRSCIEAVLKQFEASERKASQPTKREESDQDRERREREFRERRDRAERERRERDDRERREREDRERREREDRERKEREQNGKPTNVCTHDDWKNNRPCAQP